jgi:hypothetical protein
LRANKWFKVVRIELISNFADEKSDQIRNKKSSSKEVNMGYWFSGFFLRTTAQDNLPELVSSMHQFPVVVDLPASWHPPGAGAPPEKLMADPAFIDREHFQLLLHTGEIRVYSIWE